MYDVRIVAPAVVLLLLTATVSSSSDPVVITGKVVDQAGHPVAGADVWTDPCGCEEPIATKCDADGRFRLVLCETDSSLSWVLAYAPGMTLAEATYDPREPTSLILALEPASEVQGIVVGPTDEPIAGATVALGTIFPRAAGGQGKAITLFGRSPIHTETDAAGRFTMGHVTEGAKVGLRVVADGFGIRRADWFLLNEHAVAGVTWDHVIRLQPGGFIEGMVTHEGQPVVGRRIKARATELEMEDDEAVTDAAGRYRFTHLTPGSYDILVLDVDDLIAPARAAVAVQPEQTVANIDFDLTPGGFVEGQVVDADTGQPIAKGCVTARDPSRASSGGTISPLFARVDVDGRYRIRVAPGKIQVCFQPDSDEFVDRYKEVEVDVAEGQTVRVPDILVKRRAPIEVTAVDPDRRPVQGASVKAPSDFADEERHTDTEGKAAVRYVRLEGGVTFLAWHQERRLAGFGELPDPEGPSALTLHLEPCASIRMRLVDPEGKPVAGVPVEVSLYTHAGSTVLRPGEAALAVAESDADGAIRWDLLPGGVEAWFRIDMYPGWLDWKRVEWPEPLGLRAGEEHDLGDIVMQRHATMSVSGSVMLPDLRPVSDATIWPDVPDAAPIPTDGDGRFTVEDVRPSKSIVAVGRSADGKLFGADEVVPEWELDLAIILAPPVSAKVRVVNADGRPVARCRIVCTANVYSLGGYIRREWDVLTDEEGRATMRGLIAGMKYDLRAYARDLGGMTEKQFVPEPAEEYDVGDLVLGK